MNPPTVGHTPASYKFTYQDAERKIEIELKADGAPHHLVTSAYIDFLRAIGYAVSQTHEPDITELEQ